MEFHLRCLNQMKGKKGLCFLFMIKSDSFKRSKFLLSGRGLHKKKLIKPGQNEIKCFQLTEFL